MRAIAAMFAVVAPAVMFGVVPLAAAEPNIGCGPDRATAMQSALAQYPADPTTGWKWVSRPYASNYDPCADLSAALVTVESGTGGSPDQAFMFHRGAFLGTGTSHAYPFTNLLVGASTEDTVVLSYRWGQTCNACGDGKSTTVRYHWDGTRVQMLDPAPPEV